jgi:hypothetical protein
VKAALLRAHLLIWTATLLPAAIVALAGLGPATREALAFAPHPAPGNLHDALALTTNNARVVAALALAAWAADRAGPTRPAVDAMVLLITAANTTLVGVAIGAYGAAALPWLVHLPLDGTALAFGLAAYLAGRRAPMPLASALSTLLAALALLLAAGLAESFLTPQA